MTYKSANPQKFTVGELRKFLYKFDNDDIFEPYEGDGAGIVILNPLDGKEVGCFVTTPEEK